MVAFGVDSENADQTSRLTFDDPIGWLRGSRRLSGQWPVRHPLQSDAYSDGPTRVVAVTTPVNPCRATLGQQQDQESPLSAAHVQQ